MSYVAALNDRLVGLLGPFGPLIAVGMLGVVLILISLPAMLARRKDPLDRLRERETKAATVEDKASRLRRADGNDKLEKYSNFLEPQDAQEYSAVRLKLLRAGYQSKNAVRVFHFAQFALGLGLLVLGVLYTVYKSTMTDAEMSTTSMAMQVLGPGLVGYMLPKYWVTRRVQSRTEAITNAFPDSLDMMLVCVEAGQSLDQSIVRVAKEFRSGFPDLADEFEMVSFELKAGKDKVQVLRDFSERCGVTDIASFVTVLVQSQQFGTSIADALRVYAFEMRDKRVMRAEEKANTLPTKMTLATMLLTVPPLLLILIGPSVFNIATVLGGGMAGVQDGSTDGQQ
ncbi:Type II/IV secretion system protein TadC, associated with Flp pilus assembly [Rubellimicrobium mesophilum DSM 19309]|uniref:Type II/IV secretion system protein TadC, associated with Flp pilus assembly n=1 Tax=Rubellimicrobium mesophilum DSM 19309 TaxID=442562 RepID=A0A017HTM1_9RHOB|nr:type II secretion system F family protein [Rubellimicrobium mesophilum]EYD77857.1 Type II/IV secretion system protein TadC, associated with Flp pilus assembly [Rubellimicrobium mesophilum DSM 19309]